ncbi:MAG: flagellar hook-associated protein FlgK [Deltaproteobacteria bacterium]|nr:flagellar hook-associated protein FlgK [Deltaproteobacteria bacterium]
MASLNSVLDIAKTSLLANQKAISVTSHNISNANTPGYTRQKAVLETMNPVIGPGGLLFGTGVNITSIERVYDSFQGVQLRAAGSKLSGYDTGQGLMKTLESTLYDANGSGLSSPLDGFFNAFHNVANNPASSAERSTLLSNATILADRFNSVNTSIRQNLTNINNEVGAQIDKVNTLSRQVAELNNQISTVEIAGITANDLRDKRDLLLDNISKIINITTRENNNGVMDVYTSRGSFLVEGVKASPLTAGVNDSNPFLSDIISNGSVITNTINGGSLKGLIDASGKYQETIDKVNLMAATLIKAVNVQHRAGFGLDGSTGVDFFAPANVYTKPSFSNTGGAAISAGAVTDQSLLTVNDYEIRFINPSNYTIVNKSTNAVVLNGAYTSGSAIAFDGLSFVISNNTGAPAAGDAFTISTTRYAAQNMRVAVTNTDRVAAASSAATLPGDNTNALTMADIKNSPVLNGSTLNQYFNALVADIGVVTNSAATNRDAQSKVVEELQLARDSISGVSLEEEAVSLIKLQKAYEASAKVMATADKMFDALLAIR